MKISEIVRKNKKHAMLVTMEKEIKMTKIFSISWTKRRS